MTQALLEKYARLLVQCGLNVQPGQKVEINIAVDQHPFAALLTEECYKAGARQVSIEWGFDQKSVLDYTYATTETLSTVLPWQEAKAAQMVEDLPARFHILSEDPDALANISPEKLSAVSQARSKVMKPYRNQMDGKYQWCIAAVPSPAWAKKVFPALSEEDAVEALWQAILTTCSVTEDNDAVADRRAHDDFTATKAQWLTQQQFTALRYSSQNGTDFTVSLIPGAAWVAAGETNPQNGAFYIPNLPTEEVFTSPLAGACSGTVVSTKPLSWNSQIIDQFSITFEDGKAVSCQAQVGQEALEKLIHMDETACLLGEVALVPKESPINRTGLMFYNTLFDENACCHLALGCGFKEVLPGGNDLTVEEAQQQGVNDSLIHVDFMIGSEDLSIVGVKADGTEVPVFVDGTWA
jgi:aminopeptidase